MDPRPGRSTLLLLLGSLLLCLAVAALAVPGAGYARDAAEEGVTLQDRPMRVSLPAHQQYGVYVDDTDNSGYSEDCSITEADGQEVELHDPWWTVSSSDTEMLDITFDTGSGQLTIDCDISAERASVRPVPDLKGLLVGMGLAGSLGSAGVVSLVVRSRSRRPRSPYAAVGWHGHDAMALPPPGWYPDPHDPARPRFWDGRSWT